MKKFINLFVILALVVVGFSSCEEKEEVPGGIPGMGNTPGELEVKEPFTVPDGIVISEVQGVEGEDVSLDGLFNETKLKSINDAFVNIYGCGGSYHRGVWHLWVNVDITLQNTSDEKRCFLFKRGTIFEVSNKKYQNAILASDVSICLKPGETRSIRLVLFCTNRGYGASNINVTYKILGVTGSKVLWTQVLDRIINKKINIKNFLIGPSASLKSASEYNLEKYKEVADHIQNAIWTLTNDGTDLSEEQVSYLEAIQEIDE